MKPKPCEVHHILDWNIIYHRFPPDFSWKCNICEKTSARFYIDLPCSEKSHLNSNHYGLNKNTTIYQDQQVHRYSLRCNTCNTISEDILFIEYEGVSDEIVITTSDSIETICDNLNQIFRK